MIVNGLKKLGDCFTDEYLLGGYVDRLLEQSSVRVEFPPELSGLAAAELRARDRAPRKDLRGSCCLTIDRADAGDMDDAIGASRVGDGYALQVHIADVSRYVEYGGALDLEASLRGSSIYLPDRRIPMLPPILTDGLCSLLPAQDREAVTVEALIDKDGQVVDYEVYKSLIRSRVKGEYPEVNSILGGRPSESVLAKYLDVLDQIALLDELAAKLNANRMRNGASAGDRDETIVSFRDGAVQLEYVRAGRAESLVEECMVLANTLAADFLVKNGLPFVLRAQPGRLALACYTCEDAAHAGMAARYAHFTSPIRRYADLRVHQILSEFLAGAPALEIHERHDGCLAQACALATKGYRRSQCLSRAADRYCYCRYMGKRSGEEFFGRVVGRDSRGRCLVALDDLGIKVPAGEGRGLSEGARLALRVEVGTRGNSLHARGVRPVAA